MEGSLAPTNRKGVLHRQLMMAMESLDQRRKSVANR